MRKFLIIFLFISSLTQAQGKFNFFFDDDLQPATKTFKTNVIANGSTVSSSTLNAVDNFVKDTKSIRSKLLRVNLFCGADTGACFIPLFNNADDSGTPLGYVKDLNVNLDAADYTEATGLVGNGSDEYLNTGFDPNALSQIGNGDCGLGIYTSSVTAPTGALIGGSSGTYNFYIYPEFTDGKSYLGMADGATGIASVTDSGFIFFTRTLTTEARIFINGAKTTVVRNANSEASTPIYVLARHNLGSATQHSNKPLLAYVITAGLTDSEAALLTTAMEKFQDALGRGVF